MRRLTVLHDPTCPMCVALSAWLVGQPQLIPLDTVPAGTVAARTRFPGLDPQVSLREVTVIADSGEVWTGPSAFVMCLWATASGRASALWLARGEHLRLARAMAYAAAGLRTALSSGAGPASGSGGGDYPDLGEACYPGSNCGAQVR